MIRLAIRCRLPEAETALAELLDVSPGGVEEVAAPGGRAELVEYAIYGAAGELPDMGTLRAAVGEALVEVCAESVPADWRQRWKRFYHPTLVGGRIYVRPPWERAAERAGVVEVVIDPGQGFGTGMHPTTRMCLELLLEEAPPGAFLRTARRLYSLALGRRPAAAPSFNDLGSGSGVLAIAAAKLGFHPVIATDLERAAVEETDRNARANYVAVEAVRLDLRRTVSPAGDVVAANLTRPLLEKLATDWAAAPGERPGAVIASGFLSREVEAIAAALAEADLRERRRIAAGEWGALLARAEPGVSGDQRRQRGSIT